MAASERLTLAVALQPLHGLRNGPSRYGARQQKSDLITCKSVVIDRFDWVSGAKSLLIAFLGEAPRLTTKGCK
jgi:hypothetical protein